MTRPLDAASINAIRNIKVPTNMNSSRALRDYLVSQAEAAAGGGVPQADAGQLLTLMTGSLLEIVNALGTQEEMLTTLRDNMQKVQKAAQDAPTGRHSRVSAPDERP